MIAAPDLLVEASLELHEHGVIRRIFGRPIPILIHELEYYDAIVNQCRRANPPRLVEEFASWVSAM